MSEHPIEGLMITAMNSIQDMIDVNTIIGEPIETTNNVIIIPISKVSFGFAAGGSEFKGETINEYSKKNEEEQVQYRLPFGGGSGAGVNINPVAFLVVQANNVKILPVCHSSAVDKLLDYMPEAMDKINSFVNKQMQNKKEEKSKEQSNVSSVAKNEKNERANTTNRIKPRRNRIKNNDTYEYEYNEVPSEEEFFDNEEHVDFDE